jgi:hypothetical protein
MRSLTQFATLVVAAALLSVSWGQPPAGTAAQPTMPIKQLMETTITEASNALWNAYEPPTTAEEWTELERAALAMIDAA